jgi:hypothetical protein
LGSALFANVMAHFGINYMAHLSVCLYVLFVCIIVVSYEAKRELKRAKDKPEEEVPSELTSEPAFAAESHLALHGSRQGAMPPLSEF